jgi:hypothetical protein
MHAGNQKNQTEVLALSQVPGGTDVWDRPPARSSSIKIPTTTSGSQRDGGRQVASLTAQQQAQQMTDHVQAE